MVVDGDVVVEEVFVWCDWDVGVEVDVVVVVECCEVGEFIVEVEVGYVEDDVVGLVVGVGDGVGDYVLGGEFGVVVYVGYELVVVGVV